MSMEDARDEGSGVLCRAQDVDDYPGVFCISTASVASTFGRQAVRALTREEPSGHQCVVWTKE